MATQTSIAWQTSDDLRIEGVYLRPANAPSGEALPLVIVAHGGPEWQSLDGWTTHPLSPVQLLVARGYAVLLPNYRGSAGRGGQFAMADQGDLGGREFQDVLEGIDHLAARGDVDPKRVALLGGSYGGYFAGLAATRHSGRFAAAISFAGISDWGSFTGTSDIPQENSLVHWGLHCYDSRENAERCRAGSPMAYLDGAQTPLLLLHGAEDHRVPLSQAQQLYIAFRHKNVPVELVIYPREGHGIAERAHQQDTIDRILDWLRAHLEPGPADRS